MANAPNGTDAWFGIYAKQVKGPVDVGLAQTMAYQPLSVLKLIPHLYVMDKLDQDPASTCSTRRTASAGCAEEQAGRGLVPRSGRPDADVLRDASPDPDARARRVAEPGP